MGRVCIVIPAFNPDYRLENLISELSGYDVIVVDDGSGNSFNFEGLNATVLRHSKNLGKGDALKTAFNYIISSKPDYTGVVTADCDGQHCPSDIMAMAEKLTADSRQVIFGCRNFDLKTTPFRSFLGNKITSFVLGFIHKIRLSDTQTGLRAIPVNLLPLLIKTSGKGFEYETAVLLSLKKHNIPMNEFKIKTIYIQNNKTSKFNPFSDSVKIYTKLLFGDAE